MILGTDSLSEDEKDYVNSACREKKTHLLRNNYEMSKWSFGDAFLVTDWKTVHYNIAI